MNIRPPITTQRVFSQNCRSLGPDRHILPYGVGLRTGRKLLLVIELAEYFGLLLSLNMQDWQIIENTDRKQSCVGPMTDKKIFSGEKSLLSVLSLNALVCEINI